MTQHNFNSLSPASRSGADLEVLFNAILSSHSGTSRPPKIIPGMMWVKWVTGGGEVYFSTDSGDALLGSFDFASHTFKVASSGAGSGFDADKLDGLHASSFMRKDANEPLTDRGGNQIIMQGWAFTGDNRFYFVPRLDDGSDWDWGNQLRWNRAQGRWEFSGVVTSQGQPLWHAGNDGAGSGLNADKLDGLHASSFMRTFTSGPHALVSGGQITFAHGLGKRPKFIHYTLECLSAEHGYSVGDFVAADGAGGNATNTRYVSAEWDDTDVRVRMSNDPWVFALAHKTTGAGLGLTNSKWQVHVEVAA